jgi:hypothetical protein
VQGNHYVFGAPPSSDAPTAFDFASNGAGRGRGRNLPAWMQQPK